MLSKKLRYFSLALWLAAASWQRAIAEEPAAHRSRAEMEQFLLNAEILQRKGIGQGVTDSEKALLSDGKLQHEAHIQSIDVQNNTFTSSRGTELNFKDSYKFNIAAYRLDKIMDLNMIPVSVVRKVGGKTSAVTWWVDDKMFDDVDRKKQGIEPPNQDDWNKQMYVVRVFDQLIYNTDRNLGNLVIDKQWRMWMIDHTRAFRLQTKLLNEKNLVMCDRKLLANLRKLNQDTLEEQLLPFLTKGEVKAMLTRRDLIVKFFENAVKEKGEGAVLYDMPPRE
ncbi:MAG TPA: hypothetical protein VNH83_01655 [Bryobacteraceae bacterium]|jgi:hypothetical protein|nr:hypothetical protein [Bryobacteraceae bacterium]